MKKSFVLFLLAGLLVVSVNAEIFPVEFLKVTDQIWIHRSYEMVSGYKTPSNGLILETGRSVIVIDTAWNDPETIQIIDYVKKTVKKPIAAWFVTHFHQDRAGGIRVAAQNNIPIYMTDLTRKLLPQNSVTYTYTNLKNGPIKIDDLLLDVEYLGPAHSPDNIIIDDPKDKLLFGGCLVKALDSPNIGNTTDADLKNWPVVIRQLQNRYRDSKIVIPGHGEAGGMQLLEHTLALLK